MGLLRNVPAEGDSHLIAQPAARLAILAPEVTQLPVTPW